MPVLAFVIVTVASCTLAPMGSTTVPTTEPAVSCPHNDIPDMTIRKAMNHPIFQARIAPPQPSFFGSIYISIVINLVHSRLEYSLVDANEIQAQGFRDVLQFPTSFLQSFRYCVVPSRIV